MGLARPVVLIKILENLKKRRVLSSNDAGVRRYFVDLKADDHRLVEANF